MQLKQPILEQSIQSAPPGGVLVTGNIKPRFESILTPDTLTFIATLHRQFETQRQTLLQKRAERQKEFDRGILPEFLPETESIRNADWTVSPIPSDLEDRRVEITGPVDRKMIINALNAPVKVFMADFEDSNSPTWDNTINGQLNLRDANDRSITFIHPVKKKVYSLNDKVATLMVRPRGWHLDEKHILVDGISISASLLDFGLYFFHNAKWLIENGTGPYFYLPKLENHLEARLWNDVFITAQNLLGVPRGSIRATVLIETITAAFEMDEILYELKEHSAGLNCGRWDYIFSFIKKFGKNKDFLFPNREQITMDRHFLKSYVKLLVQICHKRGIHAMGGMAAQIPIKNDEAANHEALEKVRLDKEREAEAGHDGTWVAHPGLAQITLDAFNEKMPEKNQINKVQNHHKITSQDLLRVPKGTITEEGFLHNIRVGIQYLTVWLNGNGCVPLYHLMEDAATAEICRTQLWQWIHHKASFENGNLITKDHFESSVIYIMEELKSKTNVNYETAGEMFASMVLSESLDEFLTIPAYKQLD
jgi:malate synthase|tara:strand:+ start:1900 stop:3510 length:1611 start_codon:yes stop_codon:yes gene_type:complete